MRKKKYRKREKAEKTASWTELSQGETQEIVFCKSRMIFPAARLCRQKCEQLLFTPHSDGLSRCGGLRKVQDFSIKAFSPASPRPMTCCRLTWSLTLVSTDAGLTFENEGAVSASLIKASVLVYKLISYRRMVHTLRQESTVPIHNQLVNWQLMLVN